MYPKDSILPQRFLHIHVYCCIIHNREAIELAYMSIKKRTNNENVVLKHNGNLFHCKEKRHHQNIQRNPASSVIWA